MKRLRCRLVAGAAALVMLAIAGWGMLALCYAPGLAPSVRPVCAAIYAVLALAAIALFLVRRFRRYALAAFALELALLLVWWSGIEPSNDRDWQTEVAVLPHATIDGNHVTVHNIRNFAYRTESDFTPAYYDKTFDLDELDSVDLIASYWMGPQIAHLLVSFGFAGDRDHVAVSVETRKERGEGYSTVKGFFRNYELYYVVADERDLIGVRTNYRSDPPESVYLYRANGPRENARRLFLDYIREINSLAKQPEFYNTLTTNCTTNILMHTRVNPGRLRYSWKILLSGYAPQYAYESGRLDTSLPFAELERRSQINDQARAGGIAPDFSQRIRARLVRPMEPGVVNGDR